MARVTPRQGPLPRFVAAVGSVPGRRETLRQSVTALLASRVDVVLLVLSDMLTSF